jgi:hypothetical protein
MVSSPAEGYTGVVNVGPVPWEVPPVAVVYQLSVPLGAEAFNVAVAPAHVVTGVVTVGDGGVEQSISA